MAPIRVGIVGCGEVTQIVHLPTLAQLPEQFTPVALCDASDQVLQAVGERWGVAARTLDYRELCAMSQLDAVLIASPNAFHAAVTLEALRNGKHVLVEKPMCMNQREADEIIAAQGQAERVVQVGYMRRYAPAFLEAARLLPELGPVRFARVHDVIGANALVINATARVFKGSDVSAESGADLRDLTDRLVTEAIGPADPALRSAYGQLLGLGVHDISAMRELLGMPRGVLFAAQRQGGRAITAAFDYGDFICQYETTTDDIPRYDTTLEVYTSKAVVRVEYDTPYVLNMPIRLRVLQAGGGGTYGPNGVSERVELPTWGDAFKLEWQAFYENITSGRTPKTSPADFRQDLELFMAMIEKMRG